MSRWTHIVAAIDVDTYIESENLQGDVNELMKYAPKITGSESDADVFINILSGHNVSCWEDGKHNNYQTRIVITIIGDLRDRSHKITEKEWTKFKKFIETKIDKKGWEIRNYSCNIIDEYEDFFKK